jgi:hypothetical protein
LELYEVGPTNTLAGRSGAILDKILGCTGDPIKQIAAAGELGYYCIFAGPFSGTNMALQEGNVQIRILIEYGVAGAKVDEADLVADGKYVLKELGA